MSYVPTPVIITPTQLSTRARNLGYQLQEVIDEAQRADSRLTAQEITMALDMAKQRHSVVSRGALIGMLVAGALLFAALVLGFLAA